MTIVLHKLKRFPGSRQRRKEVGRGNASGHGTYSTRGQKGQRARTGGRGGLKRLGMRPMLMSLPKLGGFKSMYRKPLTVSCGMLEKLFSVGEVVSPSSLFQKGVISSTKSGVKILSQGALTKALTIRHCAMSKQTVEKIKSAGGTIVR